jgi:hypothetical protein
VTGKFATGKNLSMSGAAWAKTINIGTSGFVGTDGAFNPQARAVPPPCNDNNACTDDTCVGGGTGVAFCRNTPSPSGAVCEDGNACNGVETCDGLGTCQPGTNADQGSSCTDSNTCNGDETCDGFGSCLAGTPPEVDDRNACTADACDAITGVSHVPVRDGTRCNGAGVCQAGVCSVQGVVFSEDFFQFQAAPAQCDRWNEFLGNVGGGGFSSITVSGTFDTTGVTCNDPTAASQICAALHQGTFQSVVCNGHVWNTGQCGGTELAVDNTVCRCTFGFDHTLRPCIGNENWGGVGTQTCGGQSQNMTVVCQ